MTLAREIASELIKDEVEFFNDIERYNEIEVSRNGLSIREQFIKDKFYLVGSQRQILPRR